MVLMTIIRAYIQNQVASMHVLRGGGEEVYHLIHLPTYLPTLGSRCDDFSSHCKREEESFWRAALAMSIGRLRTA